MASSPRNKSCLSFDVLVCLLLVTIMSCVLPSAAALGTFGLDIHHRYSDTVKSMLNNDGLPEMDSLEYFTALVHRDHLRGRRLAGEADPTPLTFSAGNLTVRLDVLGFLHYSVVTVGTPGLPFIVALDTGSDLFWLPCECNDCPRSFVSRSGRRLDFNIYRLNGSSTNSPVSCDSAMCGSNYQCVTQQNVCAYRTSYLSFNTSSTGILLEDVLQLGTNENQPSSVNTTITFGCGVTQTGAFLSTGAPNGLFGLGLQDISVPSVLASKGLTSNSFSMCFGLDGIGRIVFGDKGSSDQKETPFSIATSNPTYIVDVEQVTLGGKVSVFEFTAIFDSGASFTMLQDPAYTTLTDSFDSQVLDSRHRNSSDFPFEFCYDLGSGSSVPQAPNMTLTMKGGDQLNLLTPLIIFRSEDSSSAYCLGVIKSANISIIGQNFMTGYRVVFDREKMVLGWKTSDCYDNEQSESGSPSSSPPPPSRTAPPPPFRTSTTPPPPRSVTGQNSTEAPPPPTEETGAPAGNGNNSPPGFRLPGTGNAARVSSFTCKLVMAFLSLFSHYLIIMSS